MIYGTSIFNPVKRLTPGLETNARSMTAIVLLIVAREHGENMGIGIVVFGVS